MITQAAIIAYNLVKKAIPNEKNEVADRLFSVTLLVFLACS